ncbi:glycosyltransferase family 4 protein [Nocardia asteroides]|uniref:glycosyltransferase family 4 protein n=1 Tax=Nocardia asteroides TaxID=1824 RepID=UPI001E3B30B6|nr:glycosyltransferase family 4 protein [Nocardia asteroides]UGT62099.1 glycosyltransferase family 4 protein [Nocardia asteroides]
MSTMSGTRQAAVGSPVPPGPPDTPGPEGSRLHIALVAPPYYEVPPSGYGGVEAVLADLADALVVRGHRVTLLGVGRPGTSARFVAVSDTPAAARLGEPFPEVVHALAVRRAIEQLHASDPVDVIHDHTFAGALNAPAFARLGIPAVITVHGSVDSELADYYREIGDSAGLVAISDRQRALAPDLNWVGRVHNALRPADWPFEPVKGDYALFLGRFSPDKGPDLAIRAAHAAGVPLVLAAKCSEPMERRYFEQTVRPLLGPTDTLVGEADATAKRTLLAGARCLLFPVRWEEPFGMVLIEALACGTPVVALRAGAVPEILTHGVTGMIADDPAELPAALHRVTALDPRDCRRAAETRFGVERLAAGYEHAYRAVRAGRAAVPVGGRA